MSIISEKIDGIIIDVAIQSSNIKNAKYNTISKLLTITFNNDLIYEYYDVEWETFTKLRLAESQGKFFSQNIVGKYKYNKINPDEL